MRTIFRHNVNWLLLMKNLHSIASNSGYTSLHYGNLTVSLFLIIVKRCTSPFFKYTYVNQVYLKCHQIISKNIAFFAFIYFSFVLLYVVFKINHINDIIELKLYCSLSKTVILSSENNFSKRLSYVLISFLNE